MFDTTDLAQQQKLAALVDACDAAKAKIEAGYTLLAEAEAQLTEAFGKEAYFHVLNRENYDTTRAKETAIQELKQNAWRQIVNKSQVEKLMSISRAEELHKNLSDPKKLPDVTVAAIIDMMRLYIDNSAAILDEAVREVYDWLRPRENSTAATYKTNQKNATFELGPKLILTWIVQHSFGKCPLQVNYYHEKHLIALDKVFFALDGKGVPDGYRSPLVDAINTSPDGRGETSYFEFRAFNNGNLHITFKRPDLVEKFNRIAGGANLKPAN